MRILTTLLGLVMAMTVCVSRAEAEVHPGYCVELLTHAGYTITTPVTVTEEGTLHITTAEGDLYLGQSTLGEESWANLRLLRTRAVESYLAEKEAIVYIIGQIDMRTTEPYCGRFPIP